MIRKLSFMLFCAVVAIGMGRLAAGMFHKYANGVSTQLDLLPSKQDAINIGQKLPPGFQVHAVDGASISLRSLINRRTIVVVQDPECHPCEELIKAMVKEYPLGKTGAGVNLIVLGFSGRNTSVDPMPAKIPTVVSMLRRGNTFFDGNLTPALFFFDGSGMLLARRSGWSGDISSTLSFP